MTRDERKHLAAALAWARADGWQMRWRGLEKGSALADPPCLRVEYDRREETLKVRWSTGIQRMEVASVAEALDLLYAVGLLSVQFSSAYAAGVESIPWHYFVSDGAGGMREFASYEEAATWAAPTNEGGPQLPVCRQRRGPFEVAA